MANHGTQAALGSSSARGDANGGAPIPERKRRRNVRSCNLLASSWRSLVRTSAEHFSPEADPAAVQLDVLSTIAQPYNSDIACDVILAGVAMIIEHHRNHRRPADTDKLMEDLAGYVTSIAKQNGLLPVN